MDTVKTMKLFNNGENGDKNKRKKKKKRDRSTWVTLPSNTEYQKEIVRDRIIQKPKEKIPLPPKKKHKAERGKDIDKKKKDKE